MRLGRGALVGKPDIDMGCGGGSAGITGVVTELVEEGGTSACSLPFQPQQLLPCYAKSIASWRV